MRKRLLTLSVILSSLVFLGGGCADTTTSSVTAPEEAAEQASYVGTWIRQATYVDGALVQTEPATLELRPYAYTSSTDVCVVDGTIATEGDTITMTLDSTDCPVGAIPDVYHSTYALSDDGGVMTLTNTEFGAEVREDYTRE